MPLWITFIYFPIAHMVWYWSGPDAIDAAAKALAAATDPAAKAKAQEALDLVLADGGYLYKAGAIDFAGGSVVHINSGIAGFVGCLIVGKRIGFGRDVMAPHSLVMSFIGATPLVVRLVRLQRRIELRGSGWCGGRVPQHLHRDRCLRNVVDVRGVDREGQANHARSHLRRGGGSCRRHACLGLRGLDGLARTRSRRRRRSASSSARR